MKPFWPLTLFTTTKAAADSAQNTAKGIDLALNRVYGSNLNALMALAAKLSAEDIAELQVAIERGNADIDTANATLEAIIARHTSIRDQRVSDASGKVAKASEAQKIAKMTLEAARKALGTE